MTALDTRTLVYYFSVMLEPWFKTSWTTGAGTYTISEAVTIPSSHQTVSNDSSKEQRVEIVEVLLVPGGGPLLLLLQTIMTLFWCPHYTALITPWSADGKTGGRSVYSTGKEVVQLLLRKIC